MDEESTLPTDNPSIPHLHRPEISYTEVAEKLDELEAALTLTDEEAVHVLEKTVCTYRHTPTRHPKEGRAFEARSDMDASHALRIVARKHGNRPPSVFFGRQCITILVRSGR